MLNVEVFGKKFAIVFDGIDNSEFLREMSIYKTEVFNSETYDYDCEVIFSKNFNLTSKIVSINPSSFFLLEDKTFAVDYGHSIIHYQLMSVPKRIVVIPKKGSFLQKFLSMECRNTLENLVQIFHELIAVPVIFFDKWRFPVHASAVYDNDLQQVIMFGGTGGVGKTSLELFLSRNKRYSFFADDICVIDKDGFAYPNLAYPKIYGYNTSPNLISVKKLLKEESTLSKIHWFFHYRLRGPSKVRRKLNPHCLFKGGVRKEKSKVGKYYILYRTATVEDVELGEISIEEAVKSTLEIIKNEYWVFLRNIRWLTVNLSLAGGDLNLKNFNLNSAKEILMEALREVEIFVLKVPIRISHNEFLRQVNKILGEKQ